MPKSETSFVPPHSIEAEKSVLSAILVNPQQLHVVIDKSQLKPEHFFKDAHQAVFTAMLDLEMQSQQFDIVTVHERVKTYSKQVVSYEYLEFHI